MKTELDTFMKKLYKGTFYNIMVSKYFKDSKGSRADQKLRADKGGRLSPYDDLVRKHSRTHELDWRLITAQMYQESRFDPKAKSWVRAKGLMQVMPRTGAELKIYDLESPDQGILAGTRVMARYSNYFNNPEINARDRIRFALASSPGHGSVHAEVLEAFRIFFQHPARLERLRGLAGRTVFIFKIVQY